MKECIFCKIVRQEAPSWKVYEDELTYAFFDINPVNPYHTLVIPKAHFVNLFDTPPETAQAVMNTAKRVIDLYAARLGMQNFQLISCAGEAAQQDVFHLHVHIVPRQFGDGQDVVWQVHPEMRPQFDDLLARLDEGPTPGD